MAVSDPRHMASYSVSDAVATYYLYVQYIHNFVFSLATIIPMHTEDVLRKGSGTLCESLLMVEAYRGNIICPNKQVDALGSTYEGHLLESETYLGGHVECLETGVYRSDIPYQWKLVPSAFDTLIGKIDAALTFAIEVEYGMQRTDVTNYDDVRGAIIERLEALRDDPCLLEEPVIYHLDVAAMYPNIILTNRLQPSSIVEEDHACAACDFNEPGNRCKRSLAWRWRGEYYPASKAETDNLRAQLSLESFDGGVPFTDLPRARQQELLKERLKRYSQTVYKRVKDTVETDRTATICQRENPFYVNTVRAFRDRRYEYKGKTKEWNKKLAAAEKSGAALDAELARARVVLYDSLQLAHKCILNSFYGYVMRRGARWHSMEMAGVVTYTGSQLIQQARSLVEQVGRPLELDTDGIWCILPKSFPDKFAFATAKGGKLPISYPCVMLNADVHERYTNHQYQELVSSPGCAPAYTIRSECSIFFELDGPYAAMVLPASQEEGKLLKKRYAVFHPDGSLAELKGFELKRRGELKMVKVFQQQVFGRFLDGGSLEECYRSVASVADYWLDVLDTQGEDLDDSELLDLLAENRSMSRTLEDYGEQKSVAISTARRLAEFLGADMVKDKGLACKLLVAKKPAGAPVTERAIPTSIFEAEPSIMRHFLRKWCRDSSMTDFDVRSLLDWDYYRTRLIAAVQKIITIPAALQGIPNPCPRAPHPEWLDRAVKRRATAHLQMKVTDWIAKGGKGSGSSSGGGKASPGGGGASTDVMDIEDGLTSGGAPGSSPSSAAAAAGGRATTSKGKMRKLGLLDGAANGHNADVSGTSPAGGDVSEPSSSSSDAIVVAGPPAPPLPSKPSADELSAWLASRKTSWKAQLAARKRARLTSGGAAGGGPDDEEGIAAGSGRGKGGKQGKLTAAKNQPSSSNSSNSAGPSPFAGGAWQLLEVRRQSDVSPSADPGSFSLLALTGPRRLQSVPLEVPRKFFIASRSLQLGTQPFFRDNARLCGTGEYRLPHDAVTPVLYQVSYPERRFARAGRGSAAGATGALLRLMDAEPDIIGVYETGTPLPVRPLLALGAMSRMTSGKRTALAEAAAVAAREAAQARMARQKAALAARRGNSRGKGKASAAAATSVVPLLLVPAAPRSSASAVPVRRQLTLLPVPPAGASPPAAARTRPAALEDAAAAPAAAPSSPSSRLNDDVAAAEESGSRPIAGSMGSQSQPDAAAVAPSSSTVDGTAMNVEQQPLAQQLQPSVSLSGAAADGESAPLEDTQSLLMAGLNSDAAAAAASSSSSSSIAAAAAAVPPPAVGAEEEEHDDSENLLAELAQGASSSSEVINSDNSGSNSSGTGTSSAAASSSSLSAAPAAAAATAAPRGRGRPAGASSASSAPRKPTGALSALSTSSNKGQLRKAAKGTADIASSFAKAAVAAAGGSAGFFGAGSGSVGGGGGGVSLGDPSTVPSNASFALDELEPVAGNTTSMYLDPSAPGGPVYRRAFLFHTGHIKPRGAPSGRSFSLTGVFIIQESDAAAIAGWMQEWISQVAASQGLEPEQLDAATVATIKASAATAAVGLHMPVHVSAHFFVTSTSSSSSSAGAAAAGGGGKKKDADAPRSPKLAQQWTSTLNEFVNGPNGSPFPSAALNRLSDAKWSVCDAPKDVWRKVSTLLTEAGPAGGARNPPLVLLACTPLDKPSLLSLMPGALASVPVVPVPFVYTDMAARTPLDGWEAATVRFACMAWAESLPYWKDVLALARYAVIPLANLADMACEQYALARQAQLSAAVAVRLAARGGGAAAAALLSGPLLTSLSSSLRLPLPPLADLLAIPIADLVFARLLTSSHHHVLWYSHRSQPDLGLQSLLQGVSGETATLAQWYAGAVATGDVAAILGSAAAAAAGGGGWDGTTGAAGSSKMASAGGGGGSSSSSSSASAVAMAGGSSHVIGAPTGEPAKGSVLIGPCANPVMSWPGCYRCVTVEFALQQLAVNTVLNSDFLSDGDGGGDVSGGDVSGGGVSMAAYEHQYEMMVRAAALGAEAEARAFDDLVRSSKMISASSLVPVRGSEADAGGGSGSTGGDVPSSCVGAYRALHSLLQMWKADTTRGAAGPSAEIASFLLSRFYTWLAAPSSCLHDPGLQRLVQRQMRTTLDALLRGLKSSGCALVHATFDRIIVACPGRHSREGALNFLSHTAAKLTSQPAFRDLTLQPLRAWRALLWYDYANFSGLPLALPQSPSVAADGSIIQPPPLPTAVQREEAAVDAMTAALIRGAAGSEDGVGYGIASSTWRDMEDAWVDDVTGVTSAEDPCIPVHSWSLADYLTSRTRPYFRQVTEQWLMRPYKARAKRAWRRLRTKWKAGAEGAIKDALAAAASRHGPAAGPVHVATLLLGAAHPATLQIAEEASAAAGSVITVGAGLRRQDSDALGGAPDDENGAGGSGDDVAMAEAGDGTPQASPVKRQQNRSDGSSSNGDDGMEEEEDNADVIPSTPAGAWDAPVDSTPASGEPGSALDTSGRLGFTSQRAAILTRGQLLTSVLGASHAAGTAATTVNLSKSEEAEEAVAEVGFLRKLITAYLQPKMFESLHDLAKGGHADVEDVGRDVMHAAPWKGGGTGATEHSDLALWRRTTIPGSVARPSLQYVKTALAVLGLDDRLRHELDVLRSTLLRQLEVRDFSAEARFSDPAGTVLLPDVVCASCHRCRDHLDLARDPGLHITFAPAPGAKVSSSGTRKRRQYDDDDDASRMTGDDDDEEAEQEQPYTVTYAWLCDGCGSPYDNAELEGALVDIVTYRSRCYLLQDAFCVKCSRARASPMRPHCECAGRYRAAESPDAFRAAMRVYTALAERFGFTWLQEELAALASQ